MKLPALAQPFRHCPSRFAAGRKVRGISDFNGMQNSALVLMKCKQQIARRNAVCDSRFHDKFGTQSSNRCILKQDALGVEIRGSDFRSREVLFGAAEMIEEFDVMGRLSYKSSNNPRGSASGLADEAFVRKRQIAKKRFDCVAGVPCRKAQPILHIQQKPSHGSASAVRAFLLWSA